MPFGHRMTSLSRLLARSPHEWETPDAFWASIALAIHGKGGRVAAVGEVKVIRTRPTSRKRPNIAGFQRGSAPLAEFQRTESFGGVRGNAPAGFGATPQ